MYYVIHCSTIIYKNILSVWFTLINVTAKDATDEFEAASHSHEAREMMQAFCVGIYMEVFESTTF